MKITPDTNVLLRAIILDDERQAKIAERELTNAELVAVTIPSLCELVWLLSRGYKLPSATIAKTIRDLVAAENVVVNRPIVEAGLVHLDAGGDFADGAIAYEGYWLGADTFVSFDKKAINIVNKDGAAARLL